MCLNNFFTSIFISKLFLSMSQHLHIAKSNDHILIFTLLDLSISFETIGHLSYNTWLSVFCICQNFLPPLATCFSFFFLSHLLSLTTKYWDRLGLYSWASLLLLFLVFCGSHLAIDFNTCRWWWLTKLYFKPRSFNINSTWMPKRNLNINKSKLRKKCLAYSRCSTNTCWKNK